MQRILEFQMDYVFKNAKRNIPHLIARLHTKKQQFPTSPDARVQRSGLLGQNFTSLQTLSIAKKRLEVYAWCIMPYMFI